LLITLLIALFATSCARRADTSPKPQAPPPFEFLGAWGDKGEGPGKLDEPVTFAVDTLGNVFFADPGAGFVHKFESKGTPLLSFEDTRLHHASGIAVDSGGAIYVADAERGAVLIFFPDGTFLRAMQIPSQPHFSGLLGITVDDAGDLYVPDPARSRVTKFNARGRLVKSWAVPKNAAADERPSAVAAAEDGSVFVAFAKTGRIEKYSSDGMSITSWTAADNLGGDSHSITGFAVSGQFVFTLTISPPQIRVWTLDGQHKLDADLGEQLGAISAPPAAAVTSGGLQVEPAPVAALLPALQIAVTPHAELLVFDPSAPRVFRFRMHLETKELK
jgi:DNA-binding beta-propeller fold protein YncE